MTQHRVLLFAGLRELCGNAWMEVELASGSSIEDLRRVAGELQPVLREASFRVAVDSRYVESTDVLPENCEIAFLPPVSGG
ncbi:MAG: MoaD/ThiS family protein [Planctomycetota bacterium]|jgi:molybdopterin synthase catalytic subunit